MEYSVDPLYREIELTDEGKEKLSAACGALTSFQQGPQRSEEMIIQAITAKELFIRDQHYVLEGDKVVIVDEFTGRLMPDRTWRHGLHQAIEAKEAVPINPAKDTHAEPLCSATYDNSTS